MKDQIIELLAELLNVPADTITEDTMASDIESWDSLNHVLIIGALEERLGIVIPLDEAAEITGVKELLDACGV
ncbi:MAG: acyl carrier protein [Lachnospiraceae bacterium]|nr:acyl carrier protein [Lachnospiraceae bacterium]